MANIKNKKDFEEYLNILYDETLDIHAALENFDYLTVENRKNRTTKSRIISYYQNQELGSLLKKYDPISFNTMFNEQLGSYERGGNLEYNQEEIIDEQKAGNFVEEVKDIHSQVKQIVLKDGTVIKGENLMEEGGGIDGEKILNKGFKFKVGDKIKVPQYEGSELKKLGASIVDTYLAEQNDGSYYPFYWVVGDWDNALRLLYDEEKILSYGNKPNTTNEYEGGGGIDYIGETYIGGDKNERINEMVEGWNEDGVAFSHLNYDDSKFFETIGIPMGSVGITSQTGNDIVYYNTDIYDNDDDALRKRKKETHADGGEITAKYIGEDDWSRRLYKGSNGKIYADIDGVLHHITNEGEPLYPARNVNRVEPVGEPKVDSSFYYMMLGRLQSDVKYYLGYGGRNDKNLWAGNVDKHIKEMKRLWNKVSEKPEWLSMEEILEYEKKMNGEFSDGGEMEFDAKAKQHYISHEESKKIQEVIDTKFNSEYPTDKYVYKFNEERGEITAYVEKMSDGETVWEFRYPDHDLPEEDRDSQSKPIDDGFMRHWDDVTGLETYLKSLNVISNDDTLISESEANNKYNYYCDGGYMEEGGNVSARLDELNIKLIYAKDFTPHKVPYYEQRIKEIKEQNTVDYGFVKPKESYEVGESVMMKDTFGDFNIPTKIKDTISQDGFKLYLVEDGDGAYMADELKPIMFKRGGKLWIADALSGKKGALRTFAKRKGILHGKHDKLTVKDLHKLEHMGGITAKRAHLAETLSHFGRGGGISGNLSTTYTNPFEYLKAMGATVNSDLNYSTEHNGINYYIGQKGNKAIVIAFIEDEDNYIIDKEDAVEMSLTAKTNGIESVELYTNYGIEIHSKYEKPQDIGFDKIYKVSFGLAKGGLIEDEGFYLELYVNGKQRGVTDNMSFENAVHEAKKRMKGFSQITGDKNNLLPYSEIRVVSKKTDVVAYVIDMVLHKEGKSYIIKKESGGELNGMVLPYQEFITHTKGEIDLTKSKEYFAKEMAKNYAKQLNKRNTPKVFDYFNRDAGAFHAVRDLLEGIKTLNFIDVVGRFKILYPSASEDWKYALQSGLLIKSGEREGHYYDKPFVFNDPLAVRIREGGFDKIRPVIQEILSSTYGKGGLIEDEVAFKAKAQTIFAIAATKAINSPQFKKLNKKAKEMLDEIESNAMKLKSKFKI